jgi:hypothetical protein
MAIYYLDIDDEVTSAAARIRDSSDSRIAIVLVGGSHVATSRINFRLLAREAKARQKRLAIIAADPSVLSIARSANLPVYNSVGEYERAEAARARGLADGTTTEVGDALDELALTVAPGAHGTPGAVRGGAPAGSPSRVAAAYGTGGGQAGRSWFRANRPAIAGLGIALALVLGAGAFFFFPSASVVVTLREESLGPMTISVKVDPGVAVGNDQAGVVPGLTRTIPVSVKGSYEATGEKVEETAATGTVTFTNLNNLEDVSIPTGTRLATADGLVFLTTSAVVVRMATTSPELVLTPGKVDAPVIAESKGLGGNVAAFSITKAPPTLSAKKVVVTNKAPTTGGTRTVTPQVQQADLDRAQEDALTRLMTNFRSAVAAPSAIPSGATLIESSARLGAAVCSPDAEGIVGADAEAFELSCESTGTVILADMASVRSLAERRIKGQVKTGYMLVDGSLTTQLGTPIIHGSTVLVPVTVRASQVRSVDADSIRAGVKGKSLEEARVFVSQYGEVEISVSPGWASTMPAFDFRIDVQFVVPGADASPSASTTPSGAVVGPSGPPATVARSVPPVSSGSPAPSGSVSPGPTVPGSAAPTDTTIPSASASPAAWPPGTAIRRAKRGDTSASTSANAG